MTIAAIMRQRALKQQREHESITIYNANAEQLEEFVKLMGCHYQAFGAVPSTNEEFTRILRSHVLMELKGRLHSTEIDVTKAAPWLGVQLGDSVTQNLHMNEYYQTIVQMLIQDINKHCAYCGKRIGNGECLHACEVIK